jgi:hypothetical protein
VQPLLLAVHKAHLKVSQILHHCSHQSAAQHNFLEGVKYE